LSRCANRCRTSNSLNNNGQIAGTDGKPVLWSGNTKTILSNASGTAYDVNNKGQAVGVIGLRAVLWEGTSSTVLPFRSAPYQDNASAAYAINDAGQIVGYVADGCCPIDPALWKDANTPPTDFGYNRGSAYDINNAGQIIGATSFSGSFLFKGTGSDIILSGFPNSINNKDQIAGGDGNHAVYWFPGSGPIALGTLEGYAHAIAYGNNDEGSVVGNSYNVSGDYSSHATYWSPNTTTAIDLNGFLPESVKDAGWVLINAQAINDSGAIVGDAFNSKLGTLHAFVLTPVPEPETYAMLLAGLGVVSFLGRRKRKSGRADSAK
jgi:uncharacterized membrane protein